MVSHRLLTVGCNARGQLGTGSYDNPISFTPCQFAGCEPNQLPDATAKIRHIACGANHTVILLEHLDGSTTLWGAGDGRRGQLGVGYFRGAEERDVDPDSTWTVFHELVLGLPSQQADSEPASDKSYASRGYACQYVAAAWETTYVVLVRPGSSDVLLSMGSNEFGALGIGESEDDDMDDVVGTDAARLVRFTGPHVVDFGHLFLDGAQAGRETQSKTIHIRSLHTGPRHVVAQLVMTSVTSDPDGSSSSSYSQTALVGWGASRQCQFGQYREPFVARPTRLPINIKDDPVVSCALGNRHTVILHASGCIIEFGETPLLNTREQIYGLGCTWYGTYLQTAEGHRQVLLSAGKNAQGQLGRDDSSSAGGKTVNLPTDRALSSFVCGSEHVLATMSSSSQDASDNILVMGWGWNEHGNLGLGSFGTNTTIPTQLWPREDIEGNEKYPQKVVGVWAGYATSWLLVE